MTIATRFILTFVIAILFQCSLARADTERLRVAHSFSPNHFVSINWVRAWMDRVEDRANGEITFDYFPGEQLGKAKDVLSLVQSGVIDIGLVTPALISDKMPLSVVAELPEKFSTSCEGTNAYWTIAQKGGVLDRVELEPLGVLAVFVLVTAPYQIYMEGGTLNSIKDLPGKKIRASGGIKAIILQKLGAVSVQMAGSELMEAMSRGTVDGMMLSHPSIVSYDLQHHSSVGTISEIFGGNVSALVINRERWSKLPSKVREALETAGEETIGAGCKATDLDVERSLEVIREAGVSLVNWSEQERERLSYQLRSVAEQWTSTYDGRGKPATEVLRAFQAALERED